MKRDKQKQTAAPPRRPWQATQYAKLVRYVPSGTYYARLRVRGKLIVKSLKTDVLSVALLRLADFEKMARANAAKLDAAAAGKMTFGNALEALMARIEGSHTIKPRTKDFYRERAKALVKSWPGLLKLDVSKITKADCLQWAADFARRASATAFNNTLKILRDVLDLAVEAGARYDNPAQGIKRKPPKPKQLTLPTQEQFARFVAAIETAGTPWAKRAAQTVKFLAYTGCRKNEAANVTWADVDFDKGTLAIRITKNGKPRTIPLTADARALLLAMRAERPDEPPAANVVPLVECQKTMDTAALAAKVPRITHHDLRHLFATRCIEAGVDIPTVARWLGHQDGGALAMRVYGHLRDDHSIESAKKVSFGLEATNPPATSNVVSLGKEGVA